MKLIKTIIFFLLFVLLSQNVMAIEDPSLRSNNKIGIHLAVPDENDLNNAAQLTNSSGGDWGYVTLVIQENDLKQDKWQAVFDQLRHLHLIPIVRLATIPQGELWRKPEKKDIKFWLKFLNSLNWVVENRYIILFNEPNHGREWGGEVDPENYAIIASHFAKSLKASNQNYFVMLAGFDQVAPQQLPNYMDQAEFLRRTFHVPGFMFHSFDGLTSHSYPNPAFSGSPSAIGRGTVKGYEWELELLFNLGVTKKLPVFITETGWKRGDEIQVANNFKTAFESVWLPDDRVAAVTPFILNYQGEPFLSFSWQKYNESSFYQQYETTQLILKQAGNPKQIHSFKVISSLPKELVQDSKFELSWRTQNHGQSIWDWLDGYEFRLANNPKLKAKFSPLNEVKPGLKHETSLFVQTPLKTGIYQNQIGLYKNDELLTTLYDWQVRVIPLLDINLSYNLLFNWLDKGTDFQAEIYDVNENLVYLKANLKGEQGKIRLKKVRNIAVGETYRIVLLKPYYLPRQTYITINKKSNQAKFKSHLPLDWNKDGQWTISDLWLF